MALLVDPVLAMEAERERIADQLHNGLLQSLVVVRHAIAREGSAGDRSRATESGLPSADAALTDCLAETRRLVWHLRPRTLDAGIGAALDDLAHRFVADGGPHLVVDVSAAPALSAEQAAVVYRSVQAVGLVAPPLASLEVAVTSAERSGAVGLRVAGPLAGVESDAQVREWTGRAETYGVVVEVVLR